MKKQEGFKDLPKSFVIMLTIFGAIAEFERELILQRQREGIQLVKAAGKYKGRHEKKDQKILMAYYERTMTVTLKVLIFRSVKKSLKRVLTERAFVLKFKFRMTLTVPLRKYSSF